jgi:hypothetical protein
MIENDNTTAKTRIHNRADDNRPPPAHPANITLKAVHATSFFLVFFGQKMSGTLSICFDLEVCICRPNLAL